MLEPLNGYIALDPELNWTDVNSFFRSPGAAYAGHTVALPLIAKVPSLFYRKDAMAAVDMPPPNTWDELVLLLHKLNGSDFSADQ
ncbi:FAD-binding PCMH-type domain-containing protein [Haematococcus lacustris]|uniref:FAD-binding PCMH-type domain-containing protein n=1 Tax=Haematococcus lacustris TaxID=44745 RepID=A0A699ZFD9_HAELA|nr:FAD-binding PCMH-type domain-containing protein [Haematococcus lacustris]